MIAEHTANNAKDFISHWLLGGLMRCMLPFETLLQELSKTGEFAPALEGFHDLAITDLIADKLFIRLATLFGFLVLPLGRAVRLRAL